MTPEEPVDPILGLLEYLAYLVEALAQDLPSEAKQELARLERDLGDAEHLALPRALQSEVLRGIRSAQVLLHTGSDSRVRHAACALSRPNRMLWKWVLEGRPVASAAR